MFNKDGEIWQGCAGLRALASNWVSVWISSLIEHSTINVGLMVENKGVLRLDGAIKGQGGSDGGEVY